MRALRVRPHRFTVLRPQPTNDGEHLVLLDQPPDLSHRVRRVVGVVVDVVDDLPPVDAALAVWPLRALMYEKYAFIAVEIVAYGDAGPVSGWVPPIVIVLAVMPSTAGAEVALAAMTPSAATSAALVSTTLFMPCPPE